MSSAPLVCACRAASLRLVLRLLARMAFLGQRLDLRADASASLRNRSRAAASCAVSACLGNVRSVGSFGLGHQRHFGFQLHLDGLLGLATGTVLIEAGRAWSSANGPIHVSKHHFSTGPRGVQRRGSRSSGCRNTLPNSTISRLSGSNTQGASCGPIRPSLNADALDRAIHAAVAALEPVMRTVTLRWSCKHLLSEALFAIAYKKDGQGTTFVYGYFYRNAQQLLQSLTLRHAPASAFYMKMGQFVAQAEGAALDRPYPPFACGRSRARACPR